jgi:hypothetical protein
MNVYCLEFNFNSAYARRKQAQVLDRLRIDVSRMGLEHGCK